MPAHDLVLHSEARQELDKTQQYSGSKQKLNLDFECKYLNIQETDEGKEV